MVVVTLCHSVFRPGSESGLGQLRYCLKALYRTMAIRITIISQIMVTAITVDGVTVAYDSMMNRMITHYDGLACCLVAGDHDPPINHCTASGIPAARGLCAATFGGLPFGTVLFVEGYGFAVVADRHGVPEVPTLIDLSFDPGEAGLGVWYLDTYIISIP